MPYGLLKSSLLRPEWESMRLPEGAKIDSESVFSYWSWELLGLLGPFGQATLLKAASDGSFNLISSEADVDQAFENIWVVEGLQGVFMSARQARARRLTPDHSLGMLIATYDHRVEGAPELQYGFPLFPKLNVIESDNATDLDELVVLGLDTLLSHFDLIDYPNAIVEAEGRRSLDLHEKRNIGPHVDLHIHKNADSRVECQPIDGMRKTPIRSS